MFNFRTNALHFANKNNTVLEDMSVNYNYAHVKHSNKCILLLPVLTMHTK